MIWLWILIAVVVIVLFWVFSVYNRFINLKNGIESTLEQINVALKKRLDMIGQIVDATKGEMKWEKSTLTEITKLRGAAAKQLDAKKAAEVSAAASRIAGAIAVQVEAYPDLKASENVKQLIDAVQDAEQEISRMRYTYNNTVQEFNTKREMVPTNILANMFGFSKRTYLEMQESAEELQKRPDTSLA